MDTQEDVCHIEMLWHNKFDVLPADPAAEVYADAYYYEKGDLVQRSDRPIA